MPNCPVCNSTSPRQAWAYHGTDIYACHTCDLQFAHPMQGAAVEYYRENYTEVVASMRAGQVHPGFQFIIDKLKTTVRQYLKADQHRVIDIGCGPGYVLAQLAGEGFDCFGIDFNPEVIKVAREHFKIRAEVATIEELLTINAQYDLALLIHVLEHVSDPAELLRSIRRLLASGGLVFIDLPNRNRFALRRSLKRGDYPAGDYPPHHITFWSIKSLSQALEQAGYEVIQCGARPLGHEGQVAAFLQHRLKLPRGRLTAWFTRLLNTGGRLLQLQGETIYAIARRLD